MSFNFSRNRYSSGSGLAALIVSGQLNPDKEAERVGLLMAGKEDGIIVASGNIPDGQIARFSDHAPVVATGRGCESARLRAIRVDNVWGSYRATKCLIELGLRQIAHAGGTGDFRETTQRLR